MRRMTSEGGHTQDTPSSVQISQADGTVIALPTSATSGNERNFLTSSTKLAALETNQATTLKTRPRFIVSI